MNTVDPLRDSSWRTTAIGAGAAMFLGMALGRFSYSAMIPALVESGQLDTVTAGYVGGANLGGFLIGAAVSTFASNRIGIASVLRFSIVLAIVALSASAVVPGAISLGICRAAAGIATGAIMVLGLAVTAQAAPDDRRAAAMSYIFVGVGAGILFGATAVPASLKVSILAAWITVALAGVIVGAIALYSWRGLDQIAADVPSDASLNSKSLRAANRLSWMGLIAASTLFSIGLVPHTIYWFDYLARDLELGYTIAGWHWMGVGIFAIVGPVAAAWLAGRIGNVGAIVVTYACLAAGFAMPWFSTLSVALILSTIIFGAQPAASTLLGARARDLGRPDEMPAMMRVIILANGVGSALAGIAVPMLFSATGSYELLFVLGGVAMALGGLICIPTLFTKSTSH